MSVVMAVCDQNRAPARGIETTLSQSMGDFEFILVDDNSHEKTQKAIQEYAERDSRVRLLRNERRLRLASSLNRAIRLAQTQYVVRADVNVSYQPDRLEKQLDFMASHPDIDVLGSNFHWAVEGQEGIKEIVLPEFDEGIIRRLSICNCICHPSVVFRKSRLLAFGPYREGFGKGQDYDLWMRVRKKMRFHNLQDFLLTKWHRPEPWKELSRFEYFRGGLRSRVAGLSTSPCIWLDVACLPLVFTSFVADTWAHRLITSLRRAVELRKFNGVHLVEGEGNAES